MLLFYLFDRFTLNILNREQGTCLIPYLASDWSEPGASLTSQRRHLYCRTLSSLANPTRLPPLLPQQLLRIPQQLLCIPHTFAKQSAPLYTSFKIGGCVAPLHTTSLRLPLEAGPNHDGYCQEKVPKSRSMANERSRGNVGGKYSKTSVDDGGKWCSINVVDHDTSAYSNRAFTAYTYTTSKWK